MKKTIDEAVAKLTKKYVENDDNVSSIGFDRDGFTITLYLVNNPKEDTKYPASCYGFKVVTDVIGTTTSE